MLGYGFNIFAAYSFNSAILPLFDLGKPFGLDGAFGQGLSLPQYVSRPGGSSSGASSQSFAAGSEFTSYFQGSASVAGSIGAFSGTSRAPIRKADAIPRPTAGPWWNPTHRLTGRPRLRHLGVFDEVKNDPDWKTLPATSIRRTATCSPSGFFQKFGTHFIEVSTGGALCSTSPSRLPRNTMRARSRRVRASNTTA